MCGWFLVCCPWWDSLEERINYEEDLKGGSIGNSFVLLYILWWQWYSRNNNSGEHLLLLFGSKVRLWMCVTTYTRYSIPTSGYLFIEFWIVVNCFLLYGASRSLWLSILFSEDINTLTWVPCKYSGYRNRSSHNCLFCYFIHFIFLFRSDLWGRQNMNELEQRIWSWSTSDAQIPSTLSVSSLFYLFFVILPFLLWPHKNRSSPSEKGSMRNQWSIH